MNDCFSADPLIFADIDAIKSAVAQHLAEGHSSKVLASLIDAVAGVLEVDALMARLTEKSHILGGKISMSDARLRAADLRALRFD